MANFIKSKAERNQALMMKVAAGLSLMGALLLYD
jgi:hypothetical protein